VYRVKGDDGSVNWNGVPSLGAYILHNHPSNNDGWADSFSRDDYAFMLAHEDFTEMRLVTPSARYLLHLLKPLELSGHEIYVNGAAMAFDANAYGEINHYMMLFLKERGYIDYSWEAIE
jgi:hypothetical protein